MSEGITFDPAGTVTVTFDGNTYKLRRPTFGQFRYFNRRFSETYDEAQAELQAVLKKLAAVEESGEGIEAVNAELAEIKARPLHDRMAPILAEMFSQMGDPLPESIDDWPAWLVTDATVLPEVLKHWRSTPKVSGPKEKEVTDG